MPSMKASTASASPARATAGSISCADKVDIAILVALGFRRQRMGAEKRGADGNRPFSAERARSGELAHLGLGIEPIARLDLDRRHALGDQRVEPRQRACHKVGLAGGPGRGHRRDDAAAGPRDLFVARPLQAQLELMGAVAAIDEMGVAVDQTRGDPAPRAIDTLRRIGIRGEVGLGACEGDTAITHGDDAALDHPEIGQVAPYRGQPRVMPEFDQSARPFGNSRRQKLDAWICLYI